MQPMRIHNLTQAQDPGQLRYAQSIQSRSSLLANRTRQGSVVHLRGSQVQFCYTRLCYVLSEIYLFD